MSSASSAVTYTSVYTDSEPERVFWEADEELSDGGSPRVIVYGYDELPMQPPHDPDYVPDPMYPEYIPLEDEHVLLPEEKPLLPINSPTAESPGYVVESDLEEDPEEYEDDDTDDGPVDYPMDEGDNGDDDDGDGDSSRDDADDKDEDEEDEKEEEHLALADSAIVIPTVELVSPPEGIEPIIPSHSTDTTTTKARITIRLQAAISLPLEAECWVIISINPLNLSTVSFGVDAAIEVNAAESNYSLWEVIINGDSPAPTIVVDGVVQPHKSADQKLARRNELKAYGTLLMALPDKHQLKFNSHKDAKTLMEAIEKRFGGNTKTKKVQKTLLKQKFENFSGSSSENLDLIHDRLPQLDNEDLKPIDVDDLEEMDLRWQMAMLTMRARRDILLGSVDLLRIQEGSYDWSYQAEEESANFAFMAITSSSSSSDNELSPSKPAQDLSHTTRPLVPIIEDWVFDSEDESEPNDPQSVPSFVQSSKQVKPPRHSVQPVEAPILDVTLKPTSLKSNRSGKRKNRKTFFVCRSVDHLIKDFDFHAKKKAQPTPRNYAHRGNNKQNASFTHNHPPKHMVLAAVLTQSKPGNPQYALKDKGVIDSGCSRHMTRNMSYLSYFKELNVGYVAFGGNPKGGKISSKGKIKTGKLDFEDVYFVKDLKFNLFSVSQTCDKKNKVLFTDTECLVLSHDFKLPDESQVLLRVPRENNLYNVNLKNIVPSGDLTCLFAKATIDESNLWHRRLGHINFKTIKKLFYELKGIKREFSIQRSPQQNGIAERKNKTFIEAARTMLVYSLLLIPFWAEIVNTACYVQNMLVTKPPNKTPYELLHGRTPSIGFMRPFGCLVTILNTLDPLGKFERKVYEGFLVGYFVNSKAFRVFNSRTCIVQETLHVNFLENKPNITGSGPTWLFDIDSLTRTMNYQPVTAGNQSNLSNNDEDAAFDKNEHDAKKPESTVNVSPSSSAQLWKQDDMTKKKAKGKSHVESFTRNRDLSAEVEDYSDNSSNDDNVAGSIVPAAGQNYSNSTNPFSAAGLLNTTGSSTHGKSSFKDASQLLENPDMLEMEDLTYSDHKNVGAEADFNNLETSIIVSPIPTIQTHKDHPVSQIIGDLSSTTQTRKEPKRVHQALKDPSWIEAMQEELLQFKMHIVWILVEFPHGKRVIGHTQEEGIDYEEFFAPVARIEAIRLFLAYASFMGFMVYQMDDKSAFLYGTIEEEVYVYQPLGFEDPDHPDKVYKVVKALYGLHQAPRACLDKYVAEILKKFGLTKGKSASTPIDTEKPLLEDPDGEDVDVHIYRSMISSLMYLTLSRPDIMFAICACVRFQVTPKASHLHAVKRMFRYLKGKPHLGLWYLKDSSFDLVAYSDSDYAGASLDRKSTTGGCQFLRCRLISWQCKKQTVVATSSIEAEYVAAASRYPQVLWIQNQLLDYGYIKYVLTVNPHIYVSSIKQFWNTITVKQSNDVTRLQALVDRKKVVISEAVIRYALCLVDAEGVDCLPNKEIFTGLARMGYEKPSTKLTFYKAFFSNQWKFLIHTILQSMSTKRTSWNEFSSAMASAEALDACAALSRRVEHLEHDKRVDTSDDTIMEDVSNQGRMIDELDRDEGVALMSKKEEEKKAKEVKVIAGDAQVQGRQAEIYQIDMDHAAKVLSMQEDEPEVQEVVEVVTNAKLITEVVTAASTPVSAASTIIPAVEPKVPAAAAPVKVAAASTKRRRRVVIRDLKEESSVKTPIETKSKDKVKGIMVEKPKTMKKKQQVKLDEAYARKLHEELNQDIDWDVAIDHVKQKAKEDPYVQRLDYFKGMSYDDIHLIFEAKFNTNIKFLLQSKEEIEEEENRALESINETPVQKAAKRRRLNEEAKDVEEIKQHLEIVPDEDDDVYT
uniref:Integrase catalytic domain-containing protein n=1 Tax=Tanacetum cinerariifolium TaxID=118510 RepID=A0A6L2N1Y7_TANCI|nr:hypothetical protein [Tanacetum cinerariifolium]